MTTQNVNLHTEKPKRKRGRPKKVVAPKLQVEKVVKEPELKLNQIWHGRIYRELELSLEEAGRITFYTKSKKLEIVSLREDKTIAGWKSVKKLLEQGHYTFKDSVTGTTRNRSLTANEETAETWIEGIEHMQIPSPAGGNFVIRDLSKRFEDSE